MEKFKEIEYMNTKISVSRDGRVIWNGKERKPYLNADGYLVYSIKIQNKGWRSIGAARLVAMAYIPNPNNLPEVNHKDFNRQNPNVENLEWISRKENVDYSLRNRPDLNGANNPNFGNRKLSKKYANDKELSKEKQGRKGTQNGRCRKIELYRDNSFVATFDMVSDCALFIQENYCHNVKSIESIRSRINASIRTGKPYRKMTFKFI